MDQSSQAKVTEGVTSDTPPAYSATTYQPVVMVSGALPAGAAFPPGSQGASVHPVIPAQLSDQHQIAFQQVQQLHQQQQLQTFWADQMTEIEQITEFKLHSLPLARIKKIMKADGDVRMIAGEAPVVFAKACEMFILELTLRARLHAEENKRRTLQKNDIAAAITRNDIFDFLVDVMAKDDLKEDGMGLPNTALQTMVPHYVPGMAIPFGLYSIQQPLEFVWPHPEQQISDGGQDEYVQQKRGEFPPSDWCPSVVS